MKSRKPIAVTAAILLMLGAVVGFSANPVGAVPPTADPRDAAQFGARWLITQADPSGAIGGSTLTSATYNTTATAALSLAAAEQGEETFDAAVDWLEDNAASQLPTDGSASPGLIGNLLLIAARADVDPEDFGGRNLVDLLDGTMAVSGLYGSADPTYDGVYRQSVALLGLVAVGATVPEDAVEWLVDQQCGDTPSAATGGWQAYRADTSVACSAPDPVFYTGPDSNSTALAVQALAALDVEPDEDALAYLASVQDPVGGGFAYISGSGVDANSTALVIQAIEMVGQNPFMSPWQRSGGNPLTSLLSWQIGCGDPTSVGAFEANFAPGPNLMATIQGVWGAAMADLTDLDDSWDARSVFTDVCEDNNAFYDEIEAVAHWQITEGYPDGSFRPTNLVSREVMATFLYRADGWPSFTPTSQTFSDVPPSSPFYKEIEYVAQAGLVTGYTDGTFRPNEPASREAIAAFFYRLSGSPAFSPTTQSFADVPPSNPFYEEIEWAADAGIVDGYGTGSPVFKPTEPATRQAVMAFFSRWD